MINFILYVNLAQLVVCWFIFIPSFVISRFATKIKPITFAKIGLFSTGFLLVTDMIELAVGVFAHQPVRWLSWILPMVWGIMVVFYHTSYINLKEETTSTPPSEHP